MITAGVCKRSIFCQNHQRAAPNVHATLLLLGCVSNSLCESGRCDLEWGRSSKSRIIITSTLGGVRSEYYDQHVCLSVCLSDHINVKKLHVQTSRNFLYMSLNGRGSVLLWRRQYDTLCFSAFVDDVIFSQWGQWDRISQATLYDTIRYSRLTCAQKLTTSGQLNLAHGPETKNKEKIKSKTE